LTSNELYKPEGSELYELLFQNQLHSGIEIDLQWKMNKAIRWKGMMSLGRWEVIGNREAELYDGILALERVMKYTVEGENTKVGGAPQSSWSIGGEWKILPLLSLEAGYYYNDRLYARNGELRLPSYGLL